MLTILLYICHVCTAYPHLLTWIDKTIDRIGIYSLGMSTLCHVSYLQMCTILNSLHLSHEYSFSPSANLSWQQQWQSFYIFCGDFYLCLNRFHNLLHHSVTCHLSSEEGLACTKYTISPGQSIRETDTKSKAYFRKLMTSTTYNNTIPYKCRSIERKIYISWYSH